MKKSLLLIALAAISFSANAQKNYEGSKFTDNWTIGIQGGVYEPTVGTNFFKDMRAGVNVEIQKYLTPVFGLGVNYFMGINSNNGNGRTNMFSTPSLVDNRIMPRRKTIFDFSNLSINGLINLNNLIAGYKGQPRLCEVIARAGVGWGYSFGQNSSESRIGYNKVTANFGFDVNFNVCDAWAINIKPQITYWGGAEGLDIRNSSVQLLAGVTYKFKNSNGTHHFTFNDKQYTQAQIDELNAKVNAQIAAERAAKEDAQNQLANSMKTIADLQAELAAEKAKDKTVIVNKTTTQLAPVVIYGLGKKTIDASQKPSVAMIATYMKNHPDSKVTICGYASPEGNPELNQKLSEARAQAVFDMLTKTYGIAPSRLTVKGMGVTDELFDENDWNRVATFLEDVK